MIRIIILLLLSTNTFGQTLFKHGKSDAVVTYWGIHKYLLHPTFDIGDSLKIVDKKYIDSIVSTLQNYTFSTGLTEVSGTVTNNLSTGVTGSQTLNFSTDASGGGTLQSTTHATKGTITVVGHLYPSPSATFNLGQGSNRWNGISVNGISLFTGSAPSNGSLTVSPGFSLANGTTPSPSGISILNFTSAPSSATSGTTDFMSLAAANFTPTSGTAIWNTLRIRNTINQTGGANGITRSLLIEPVLTSAVDHRAIETTVGSNIFNSSSGWTWIGGSYAPTPRKLYVNGSIGANKDSITTIASPTTHFLLAQDTSAAPELGKLKKILPAYFSSQSALNDTAAAHWAAITALSGGGSDGNGIYDGSGTLPASATTTVNGGTTSNLNLGGAGGNRLATFSVNSAGLLALNGLLQLGAANSADADYSIPAGTSVARLIEISATRTVTIPDVGSGQLLIIWNENSSGNAWNISVTGGGVINPDGSSITSFTNDSVYILLALNGNYVRIN